MVQQIQLKQEKGFQIYAKTFGNFSMICVTNNPCTGITTLQVEHLCLDKPFNRVKKTPMISHHMKVKILLGDC